MKKLIISVLIVLTIPHTFIIAQSSTTSNSFDSQKVERWIEKNAIEIQSIEPDGEDKDLRELSPMLKDRKIIGLGDATHGTKEFFVLKHKMIEYLIKNENCTAVALELLLDGGVNINNYVRTGEGDIDELLKDAWWWHGTEEIRNFLVWLKDYNLNQSNKKVSFYGFDSQVWGNNTYQLFEYYKKVDPRFDEYIKPIHSFMSEFYINNYTSFTPFRKQKYDEGITKLKELLEMNKAEYIANSSKEEYLLAKARLNSYAGIVGMKKGDLTYSLVRSEANIENIKLIAEMEEPDSKIVVWAHNGHIASDEYVMQEFFNLETKDGFYDINTMRKESLLGCLLREHFGDRYFNIGFEFHSGSFTAIEFQKKIREFTVSAPENNTLPYLLNKAKAGSNCYFIELNKDKMDKDALQYFNSIQFCHEIGAAYISRYVKKIPLSSYNAIIFFRNTTGAKLLK